MNEDDPDFMRHIEASIEAGEDELSIPMIGLHITTTAAHWDAVLAAEAAGIRTARLSYWYAWIFGALIVVYVFTGWTWTVLGFAAVMALQGFSLRSSTNYRRDRLEAFRAMRGAMPE